MEENSPADFFDMMKDLWQSRCGYIHAEKTMTEKDMRSHRTYHLLEANKDKRQLVSVMDRHLFDKKASYFFNSNHDILELWEVKFMTAIRSINTIEHGQCLLPVCRTQQIPRIIIQTLTRDSTMSITQRLERLGNYIQRAKNMCRKCIITNQDPVWNKRLKLTQRCQLKKPRRTNSNMRRTGRNKTARMEDTQLEVEIVENDTEYVHFDNNFKFNSGRS